MIFHFLTVPFEQRQNKFIGNRKCQAGDKPIISVQSDNHIYFSFPP
jgi:hypothetical protein